MNHKQSLGFTLIEFMITIAIVGIIASIAVPSYQKMIERNQLKQAAESFKSDLMLARTEAFKQSESITINRIIGNNGAWSYGFNTSACVASQSTTTAADFCDLKRVLGTGFPQTNLISQSGNTTLTSRRGTAFAGYTCFSTTHYKLRVKISPIGRITICTNTGSAAIGGGYESCLPGGQC